MRITILGGSVIVFIIYLFWELLILGNISIQENIDLLKSYHEGEKAPHLLQGILGARWSVFAQGFAFFAITTSFLAQSLGLMHFLADGIKISLERKNRWWLCLLTILPPLIFSWIYPRIFFQALSFAGGICAVILFGILPSLMAWKGRYQKKFTTSYHVKGGKISLLIAIVFALFIVFRELFRIVIEMKG